MTEPGMMFAVAAMMSDLTTRILFAVLAGANSVRDVQRAVDARSTDTVYRHLVVLRRNGLVTWEPGRQRTLRPAVEVVA